MLGWQKGREEGDEAGPEQPRDPVRAVEQGVRRGQMSPVPHQPRQQALECGAKHRLAEGEDDGRENERNRGGPAAKTPVQHHRNEHQGTREVGADHRGALVPRIRPAAGDERGREDAGEAECREISRRRAHHADRNPGQRDGIELIPNRRKRKPAPKQGERGSLSGARMRIMPP